MEAMNIKFVRTRLVTAVEQELLKLEKKWAGKEIEEVEGEVYSS